MSSPASPVLVCLDFSVATPRVLSEAAAAAGSSPMVLLHVAAPDPDFVGYETGPSTVRHQVAEDLAAEHRKVEELAATLRGMGHEAVPRTVRGAYAATILEQSTQLGARMIVVGSHGHGRLHDLFVGSVTDAVLRRARIPVLVVPRVDEEREAR